MSDASVLSGIESVTFLQWLDPTGLHNLVALDPAGSGQPEARTFNFADAAQVAEAETWVDLRNGRRNLYFSINEPRADARTASKLRRDEIGAVRAFAVDLDEVPQGYAWGDPVDDYLPSAVIDSGNGRWGFWKLAVKESGDIWDWERQNKALAAKFGGDAVATNLDRIARLPGTLNIPTESKKRKGRTEAPARVLSTSALTYTPAEVAAWCPPAARGQAKPKADQTVLVELDTPQSVARATRWLLTEAEQAIEGENGDHATYRVAARLKDFGVSQQTAFDLLLDCWNEKKAVPPWQPADLLVRIKNAFTYGTAAPARNAPNLAEAEFEAFDLPPSAVPPKSKMAYALAKDVTQDLKAEPHHLIEGWYDRGGLTVTYGESNSGKTHVVLNQGIHIAAGLPWAGKKVHQGLVVYVAAEGGFGVERRIMAHRKAYPNVNWDTVPFALIQHPIDLMRNANDSKALVGLVKQAESETGQKCVMIVIDTLSRALAGGDENSSSDMGNLVKQCDRIRFETGAALHIIHHAGKNTAKGARGHSLLRAAVDTEIEIENGTILSRKQRDAEAPSELRFQYKRVDLGENREGIMQSSVVLDVWEGTEFDLEITPLQQKVAEAALTVLMRRVQETQNLQEGEAPDLSLIMRELLTPKDVLSLMGESASKATVDRAFAELASVGIFTKSKRGQYYLNRSLKASTKPQT